MRAIYPTETYPHRINEGASSTGSFIAPVLYSDEEAAAMQAPHGSRAAQQGMGGMENYAISSDIPTGFKETQDYFDAVADLDNFVKEMYYKGYKPGEVDIRNPDTLKANQMLSQKLNGVKAIETRLKSLKNVWEDQLKRDKLTQRLPIDPNTGMPILGNSNEYFQTDFVPENTIQESSNRAFGGKQYYGREYSNAVNAVEKNRQAIIEQKQKLINQGYSPEQVDRAFNETLQQPIKQEVEPRYRDLYGSPSGGSPKAPGGGNPYTGQILDYLDQQPPVTVLKNAHSLYNTSTGKKSAVKNEIQTRYAIGVGGLPAITTNLNEFIAAGNERLPDASVKEPSGEVSFSDVAILPTWQPPNSTKRYVIPEEVYRRKLKTSPNSVSYQPMAIGSYSVSSIQAGVQKPIKKTVNGYIPLSDNIAQSMVSKAPNDKQRAALKASFDALKYKAEQLNANQPVSEEKAPEKPLKISKDSSNDQLFKAFNLGSK